MRLGLGFNRWIAGAAGIGLLVVAVGTITILSHRSSNIVAATTTPSAHSSSSGTSPLASTSQPSSSASPTGQATPTANATSAPAGAATSAPTSAPANPPAAPPPPPPSYTFNPPVSGGGPDPGVHLVAADLNGGRQIVASFTVGGAGTVSLHGFGSIGGLTACLEYGQGCTPGSVPNPAYWTLSADDIGHVGRNFRIRIYLPGSGAGIDVGWNGSHTLTLSNLYMGGSTSGYGAGAGVRYRVTTGGVSVSSGAAGRFHLKGRNKTTGTVVPANGDIGFSGSGSTGLSPYGSWTVYLWPDSAATASPTISF